MNNVFLVRVTLLCSTLIIVVNSFSPLPRYVHNIPIIRSRSTLRKKWKISDPESIGRLKMAPQYKDLLEKLPSKEVIDAIDKVSSKSSSQGQVVASDVASLAGVSLSKASEDLTALASLTSGDIAVTSDGELIYSFPSNIKQILSSKNLKYKLVSLWNKVKSPVFYLVRVSFGVVLLLSLVVVFSTLAFISSGSTSDRDDDRGRRGGFGGGLSFGYNPFWGPSPLDFFYYRPYYGYYSSPSYIRGRRMTDEPEMGFLESTFSYIFGDGNPNNNIEQESLKKIANFIRKNNGAVVAEQLAPFLIDVPSSSSTESSTVDESFVLPIVTQLNGSPQVTEDGNIVYVFPDLQISAQSPEITSNESILRRIGVNPSISTSELKNVMQSMGIPTRDALERSDLVRTLTKYAPRIKNEYDDINDYDDGLIEESTLKFSLASPFQQLLAGGLGVVNLFGSLVLGNYLAQLAAYGVRLPSYYGVVQTFYPLLLAYALFFNVIPAVRYFSIQKKNQKIQERNKKRRFWKTLVDSTARTANTVLGKKFLAASKMGNTMKLLGKNDIIYDTKADFEQNQKQIEKQRLIDFDNSLQGEGEFE